MTTQTRLKFPATVTDRTAELLNRVLALRIDIKVLVWMRAIWLLNSVVGFKARLIGTKVTSHAAIEADNFGKVVIESQIAKDLLLDLQR